MVDTEPRKLEIERFFVGELDSDAASGLQEHLTTCHLCRDYLSQLTRERDLFLANHSYAEFARKNLGTEKNWYELLLEQLRRPVLVPVIATFALLITAIPFVAQHFISGNSQIRYKGAAALTFAVRHRDIVREGSTHDTFRAGDEIQVMYTADYDQYLMLASVDSLGHVSFYYPADSNSKGSIRTGTGTRLPYPQSILLDDTPGFELIVAVFSEAYVDTTRIVDWIGEKASGTSSPEALERKLRADPPLKNAHTATILLRKE